MPFFTPGTVIATPHGERAVEELAVGDLIVTREHGTRPVRWVGKRVLNYAHLVQNPHLRPIFLRQASLGPGLPERDMMVSPNHRVLVDSGRTALFFEEHDVLVAAKHIVNAKDVRQVDVLGVTYVHFLCDGHETVMANGVWAESFHPVDTSLGAHGNAQRSEIFELFPELLQGQEPETKARDRKRRRAVLLDFVR